MKKLIFILLATIWCIGAKGQKIPQIENIVDCNTNDSIYFEYYCCDEKFRIFKKDTVNNTINYYILVGWFRKKTIRKNFQNNYFKSQTLKNDKCRFVELKKRTRAYPKIEAGTFDELKLSETKPKCGMLPKEALSKSDIIEVK